MSINCQSMWVDIMISLIALVFTVACASVTSSSDSSNCCFHVDGDTRQIIDAAGRARIFHGVNIVAKTFPYHPDNTSFDPENSLSDEDVQFLQEYGFNVVRLYVAWPGVEPKKDQYNITYLNVLQDYVNKLGKAGIYTILDCHQDLFSPKFCGEGVPDYAALYMNRTVKPLPFPQPFPQLLTPFKINETTGYPNRVDCNKHSFFTYYFSDAEGKAWQSLYDNEQHVQDRFALFWSKVSQHFSGNPHVLGYELINEPWAGDLETHPDQIEPHVADKKNLQPLYSNIFKAINQFDDGHMIFFEPTVIFTSLPLRNFSSAGFTEGPGGSQYRSRQVFSYHMYCILMDKNGQPANKVLCDLSDTESFDIHIDDQVGLGVAGFMTEWGAYTNIVKNSKAWYDAVELTNLADKHLQSWSYWQYKGYGDITTQSNTGEGLFFKNGTRQIEKITLLSRTYAKAVSGRYISQSFDIETGLFQLTFKLNNTIKMATEIYFNQDIHYPNGYTVSVSPDNTMIIQQNHNTMLLTPNTNATNNTEIAVKITRK